MRSALAAATAVTVLALLGGCGGGGDSGAPGTFPATGATTSTTPAGAAKTGGGGAADPHSAARKRKNGKAAKLAPAPQENERPRSRAECRKLAKSLVRSLETRDLLRERLQTAGCGTLTSSRGG